MREGLLIGAVFGALAGAGGACQDQPRANECNGPRVHVLAGAIAAVAYGGIGAFIDKLIVGHTTVYRSEAGRVSTRIGPYVRKGASGLLVSVSY